MLRRSLKRRFFWHPVSAQRVLVDAQLLLKSVLPVCYTLKYKKFYSADLRQDIEFTTPSPLNFTSEEPIRHVGERRERVCRHRYISTKQDDNFTTWNTLPHCVYEALLFRTCGTPI